MRIIRKGIPADKVCALFSFFLIKEVPPWETLPKKEDHLILN
jgi:hypothetical protein